MITHHSPSAFQARRQTAARSPAPRGRRPVRFTAGPLRVETVVSDAEAGTLTWAALVALAISLASVPAQ